MPRAERKSKQPRSPDENIHIGDVTAQVYPEGVPQDADGQVASGGEITVERARKIGALTANAAAANKHVARQVDRANRGESVSWNEDDPIQLFDSIKQAWPALSVRIFIKDVDTQEQYPPPSMQAFKSSAEFYDHLLKNVHRNKRSAKYEIMFKAGGNSSIRGKGFIMLPDMSDQQAPAAQAPQPVWNGYAWVGAPPPSSMMGPPPYGYPGGGYGAPQPPTQGAAPLPQPNIHIHNPMAPPQQPPQPQMPQPMPQAAPVAPVGISPLSDPNMVAWMQGQSDATRRLEMMFAEVIGANRVQLQQQAAAAVPPPAVVVPPGYQPIPGYIPPGFQPPPGYRLVPEGQIGAPPVQGGAPPPPPPPAQAQVQAPKPTNAFGVDVGTVMGAMQDFERLRKVFGGQAPGGAVAQEEEPEEVANPLVPPPPPAVTSVPLGPGDDALVYVHNPDGTPNVMGLIMGNLPKLPAMLEKAARSMSAVNRTVEDAARMRPIQAQGHTVVEQPTHFQPPRPPQRLVEAPQTMSFIPDVPR